MPTKTAVKAFVDYVWGFYAPGQVYGHFFDNALTLAEVEAAVTLRSLQPGFEGDSADREHVRNILFTAKGLNAR